MSDMTTIMPEERAEIRHIAVRTGALPGKASIYKKLAQLLDALEQAEARAEKAEAMVDWLASWGDAHPCTLDMDCPFGSTFDACDLARDSTECWKEAARRAVANSEVNNDRG